jgi:uncharacterized protein YPO0396
MLQEEIEKLRAEIKNEILRKERREGAIRELQEQLDDNSCDLKNNPEDIDINAFHRKINEDELEIKRLQNEIIVLNKNIEEATKELEVKAAKLAVKLIVKIYKSPFLFISGKNHKKNSTGHQENNKNEILFISQEFKK